jgi:hypothetical protein
VVQAEQIRLLRVLVLDDDGHVAEGGRELRREGIERGANVILERHARDATLRPDLRV